MRVLQVQANIKQPQLQGIFSQVSKSAAYPNPTVAKHWPVLLPFDTPQEQIDKIVNGPLRTADNQSTVTNAMTWLVQPADYTGDAWHVAAAMALDPQVGVVIVKKGTAKENNALPQMRNLYRRVLGGQYIQRVKELNATNASSQGVLLVREDASKNRASFTVTSCDRVVQLHTATSIIQWHVRTRGREKVALALSQAFTRGFTTDEQAQANALADYAKQLVQPFANKPIIPILYSRNATYHLQHNTSPAMANYMKDVLAKNGYIVLGDPLDVSDTTIQIHSDARFLEKRSNANFEASGWMSLSAYAWFLTVLREQAKGRAFIVGGRSGTLDAVAFLGLDALSWDSEVAVKKDYVPYCRLLLARELMAVTTVDAGPEGNSAPSPSPRFKKDFETFVQGKDRSFWPMDVRTDVPELYLDDEYAGRPG